MFINKPMIYTNLHRASRWTAMISNKLDDLELNQYTTNFYDVEVEHWWILYNSREFFMKNVLGLIS